MFVRCISSGFNIITSQRLNYPLTGLFRIRGFRVDKTPARGWSRPYLATVVGKLPVSALSL